MGKYINIARLSSPITLAGITLPPRISGSILFVIILGAIDALSYFALLKVFGRWPADARTYELMIAISAIVRFVILYVFAWPFDKIQSSKQTSALVFSVYVGFFVFQAVKMILSYSH